MSIYKQEFVAFDTETTGLFAGSSEIVEIAAVRFGLDEGPLEYFQTLIKTINETVISY